MFPYEDSEILFFFPYLEKRNRPSFVNISPTVEIDTSMERSSQVLHHGSPKILFYFQKRSKLNLTCNLICAEVPSFVNISPTPTVVIDYDGVVIDKLMEMSL